PEKGSKKLTFCALGDSGYPRRGKNVATEDQLLVAKLLAKLDPDLVVHVGDVVYQVGQEKGLDPLFFQPYQETLARVPFFCCLGNHDVKTKDGDPELRAFPHPPNEHGNRYFSFDAANVHFVCADSNDVFEIKAPKDFPETPQGKWLKSDLAAATSATWKIAYFHHRLYSCFATRVQERATIRAAFETLLEDAGVDLVICGHDHFYHRSFRMLDGKKDDEGIVHVVTGGGGATLYPGKAVEGTTACYNACYHLTRFVVDGASLEIEALAPRESGEPESIDKTKITSRKMR
ncbi:metallophosphoesterase, partial [bacterium]|nr:metallophosphoesterase [bacterium]